MRYARAYGAARFPRQVRPVEERRYHRPRLRPRKMQIHVSLNGSFAAPHGVVFVLAPDSVGDGLFAAFSCYSGKVSYNLGEVAFRHTRRRPRTSRRMPHLRARPFSVPASYSGGASWSACALWEGE